MAVHKSKHISERAKRIKKELIDLGMTQRELAEEIGMNENYLTGMLNGYKAGSKYWEQIEYTLGLHKKRKTV